MQATRLSNGVRVLSEELAELPSVTVGIWVENGSRYERPDQAGISHFLEHLFFKGTERRTAANIAEEIDAVGGVLNAFTGKEYTCYYGKVLPDHLPLALDLLADIFTHSRFAAEEIERERSVIVAESVGRFSRDDFLSFLGVRYRPDRILIAGAGNLRHDELVSVAARSFGELGGRASFVDGGPPQPQAGLWVHEKGLEQVHLCLGAPGIAQGDADRYAAHLLNLAIGGGMSSRLFQEIRERRGKAYTVYSFLASYLDVGYVGVYVGTSAEWVREVVEVIRGELGRVARDGLAEAELARVKNQMKGNMLLGLETSDSRMSRIAKNDIYFGRDVPIEEVARGIDGVGNEDIVHVAKRLFRPGTLALTVLGDLRGEKLNDEVLRE